MNTHKHIHNHYASLHIMAQEYCTPLSIQQSAKQYHHDTYKFSVSSESVVKFKLVVFWDPSSTAKKIHM